jgi:hypothetical protein
MPGWMRIRVSSAHQQAIGTNSFGFFLLSLRPARSQDMKSNGVQQLDRFPRQIINVFDNFRKGP